MNEKIIPSQLLGSTARWTAAVRGLESKREDALFRDPWATVLAGEEGAAWLAQRTEESVLPMVLRARYFDNFLQAVTDQYRIRQVVLMAAGLDTRAYRLNWPEETCLFELDQPAVLNYKEEILRSLGAQPKIKRRAISVDLTQPWKDALLTAGFDPRERSCWLMEGFLFYLPNETITQLTDEITSLSVPGSWLGFDIINNEMLISPWTKPWVDMQSQMGAPWIGVMDDPEQFLSARGWKATLTQAGQPEATCNRWRLPVLPTKMPNMPHNWFVTAQKEKA